MTYTAINLPLSIWFMRDYFMSIPIELEESAFIDGATRFQVLFRIILPLSVPGLVATFLDLAGYEVVDLGHDIANEQIIEAIERENPAVVGLSALMTTTMLQQREFINDLNSKGMRDRVKVIVGGAPATQGWADKIGADAFGADALDGRRKIDSLLGY